jgi:phosphoadenosine phosphosulfate reductase
MPAREAAPGRPASAAAPAPAVGAPAAVDWGGLTGAADPNGPIWKQGAFRLDPFRPAPLLGELGDGPAILGKARWLSERAQLLARTAPIGLLLEGGARLDDLADDLARFALIALDFPKFSDGRAYSTARLLREKFGYRGELRAVGNVLSDQIPFMRRVGFDAFAVSHGPTRRALGAGELAEVTLYYQPVGAAAEPGTRSWLRGSAG